MDTHRAEQFPDQRDGESDWDFFNRIFGKKQENPEPAIDNVAEVKMLIQKMREYCDAVERVIELACIHKPDESLIGHSNTRWYWGTNEAWDKFCRTGDASGITCGSTK